MQAKAKHKATNNRYLNDKDLLRKGMNPKNWKFKVDNNLRGAYGETNFDKKVVRINKKKHTDKKSLKSMKPYKRLPNGNESLLDTIAHERAHVLHPEAGEKATEKRARVAVKKMSTRQKKRLYALVKR